jgi:inosose dehydratase
MKKIPRSQCRAPIPRRRFIAALSSVAACAAVNDWRPVLGAEEQRASDAKEARQAATIGLGFSLYGMKALPLLDGVRLCREIGYDCTELPAMAAWPGDSLQMSAASRAELRKTFADQRLRLSAIMENLPITAEATRRQTNLERVKAAAQLAHDLSPELPHDHSPARLPVVETILGGKPGQWERLKPAMVAELRQWAKVLADAQVKLAIKAHIGNAMQRPEQLAWLLREVDSPWVKAAYDYSHFQLQKLPLGETLEVLLPETKFVHVKDSKTSGAKWQFELPGDGTIDYGDLFQRIAAGGYRGDIVVEVSGQVSSRPGYDPAAAARKCYAALAKAFAAAGIERG